MGSTKAENVGSRQTQRYGTERQPNTRDIIHPLPTVPSLACGINIGYPREFGFHVYNPIRCQETVNR